MKPRYFGIALALVLTTISAAAQAEHWQIVRTAQQLEQAADVLTQNLRNLRGYGSVSHHAQQLSRRADLLADSASRQNSSAYMRSRFADVNRYYLSLETAYLRASRSYGGNFTDADFDRISLLFHDLNYQLYGAYPRGEYYAPERYSYVPRPAPPIVFIAPLPRSDRDDRFDRRDPGLSYNSFDRYDHRSPVIERQRSREQERTGRDDRRRTETRRDNHYEGNNGSYRLGRP